MEDKSILEAILAVAGIAGLALFLYFSVWNGIIPIIGRRNNDLGINQYKLLRLFSILSAIIAVVCIVLWTYQNKTYDVDEAVLKAGFLKSPGNIVNWNKLSGKMKYYNAPFTLGGEDHLDYKARLLNDPDSSFEILFFSGGPPTAQKEYRQKLKAFKAMMVKLQKRGISSSLLQQRIKVRVDTINSSPPASFFLGNTNTGAPGVLVYMFPERMLSSTYPGKVVKPKGGFLILGHKPNGIGYEVSTYVHAWNNSWNAEGVVKLPIQFENLSN